MALFMQEPDLADSPAVLQLREHCGLTHERQIIRVALPRELGTGGFLRGVENGASYHFQRSTVQPDSGFVEVALGPFEKLTLVPSGDSRQDADDGQDARFEQIDPRTGVIGNGIFSVEVPLGTVLTEQGEDFVPGPVRRMRVGNGPWRGATFFDCRKAVRSWQGELLENGPVWIVYRFRAECASQGFYEAVLTVDRGQPLIVIEERFKTGSGDQIVWDFSGDDLPEEFYLLDSTSAYETRPLAYHLDQRLTRMICWTQQSQHFDFSDGYAIGFARHPGAGESRDIAGFVALEGGTWRGNKLNHLEAWTRRWFPGDPASRRDVAPEAKADSQPNPERIPARGQTLCEEHFNVEGWIGEGRRKWALVLTTLDKIEPPDRAAASLGHFDDTLDRPRYRAGQSLLRRIHSQRGMIPLQEMIGLEFAWEEEASKSTPFAYPNEVLGRHFAREPEPAEARRELMDYLAARVYGFWEGSGSAYTNPVSSRRVAPEMYRYEWLVRQGAFSQEEKRMARAWFAFLLHLFASENFYPGEASMLPVNSPDALDPTLAGMANQNFYTDVFNVPGTGAQIFWKHPRAGRWRAFFIARWHRQLEYHMYPESGLWEESHTYYHHVLHTVLPTFLRRRADGVDDEFANPAFQKLVGAGLRQLTPRDACFDGCRHVVIFGDHAVQVELYRDLWREFAEAISPHDRVLAGHLAWAYAEMGGRKALTTAIHAPTVRNEYVQGLGVMFRGLDETGQESLLAFRSGNAWGHHHNDDGSIQFYAKGRAMIVDAAFGLVQADARKKFEAIGHSRWTPRQAEPVNHLWRFNRGWITDSSLEGPLAYATGCSPVFLVRSTGIPAALARLPIMHFRTIVQVTAAAYLVVDTVGPAQDQAAFFHVPGSGNVEIETVSSGADVAFAEGCRLRLLPLVRLAPPRLAADHPKAPEAQRYVTTSLEYEIPRAADFSAFLIIAQAYDDPAPVIVSTEDQWRVHGNGLDFKFRQETDRRFVLTDHRTDTTRRFELGQEIETAAASEIADRQNEAHFQPNPVKIV